MQLIPHSPPVVSTSLLWLLTAFSTLAQSGPDPTFPIVPDDLEVELFAKDPLVRNPCALAFDNKGRLCVGMGPQYRKPKPDTPGDSVWILLDDDGDGLADDRKEFATGFNNIQGLAWRGDQLWIANAPDLTVVRDLDGDDVADEYIRLYSDLGNLEHGLHGLNWGPDGLLYMSKGNSKGLNQPPNRVAPKPFRDLWGVASPPGTPDFPDPVTFKPETYEKRFHNPSDDWGLCGGILRCRPDGSGLEIVAAGFRNPWDISFNDTFDWLGTDNDQSHGDKIFSPFYGAHFGWGHAWSYDWVDDQHLPTAPSAGKLFEGSGTGVIYLGLPHYPEKYRDVFLVNDWLRREIYIYRPEWKGAWMRPADAELPVFAHAERGRSMGMSDGRSFDPVDIEVGPDGAIYVASWGREYGAQLDGSGEMQNEGRIYRFWPKGAPPQPWTTNRNLLSDLGNHLPVWRTNAQEQLVAQGISSVDELKRLLANPKLPVAQETWALWTLGRIQPNAESIERYFIEELAGGPYLNRKIQSIRILAHRARLRGEAQLPKLFDQVLSSGDARLRHEGILALRQVGDRGRTEALVERATVEDDRLVFYSLWGTLGEWLSTAQLLDLFKHEHPRVRLAALLASLEQDLLDDDEIARMAKDPDSTVAAYAKKRMSGKAEGIIKGPSLTAAVNAPDAPDTPPLVAKGIKGSPHQLATLRNGAKAYTDRNYRIRDLPEELQGEVFLQLANDQAEATEGGVSFQLPYPSTVFLADDSRGDGPPIWARERFQPTSMRFHNGDSIMKVYQAEFPAGDVSLGANSEGIDARRSQYHVIIRPRLLDPPAQPPSAEAIKTAMASADPDRGRTLFLSKHGATCMTCHRMEGIGNVFAPDLSDIGTRADADFIIESILDPSAQITEGFAMQVVTTKSGETVGGIVLEETGQALTFGVVGGQRIRVPKRDIQSRETAPISAMPLLAPMLTAQQNADIVAYLINAHADGAEADKSQASSISGQTWGKPDEGFHLAGHGDRIDIKLDGRDVGTLFFDHAKTKRPFFAHIKTPSGIQVTRNFPPIEGQDPMDHAYLHPGVSLGFAVLDGENFWHTDRGKVAHDGFIGRLVASENAASFTVKQRYLGSDGRLVCHEETRYHLTRNADGYLINMKSTFSSPKRFYFGVKEEMGLAIRVASPIRVKEAKGHILNGAGGKDEKGTWGKVDTWWDYAGPIDGKHVGLQVISGKGNPPVWSHSRDYGVLVANPFPVDKKPNREIKTWVEPNQAFVLNFGIQVHEHADREEFNPARAAERFHEDE